MRSIILVAGGFAALAATIASPASATMSVSYYSVKADGRDFGNYSTPYSISSDEVLNQLSANGLPIYNPNATSPVLVDHNAAGELTWWTPNAVQTATAPVVTLTGSAIIPGNSFSDTSFFTPNGTGSDNGSSFQTAVFSGNFTFAAPQTFTFSLTADDDALLFIDNVAKLQFGGIHGSYSTTQDISLGAGNHAFKLFYADRQYTNATLNFSFPNSINITPSVPEPATWAMMIGGFGLVGGALRRRARRYAFA